MLALPSGRRASLLRIAAGGLQLRWALFADILRVGLVGTVSTVATSTSASHSLGGLPGTAAFGLWHRITAGVSAQFRWGVWAHPGWPWFGTIGASQRGLYAARHPGWCGDWIRDDQGHWPAGLQLIRRPRQSLFNAKPAMSEAGSRYRGSSGPWYGFFGLGLVLYFTASEGAGRLLWPVLAATSHAWW